jgi:hypothetical protein
VYSRFRQSFYALLLIELFSVLVMMTKTENNPIKPEPWRGMPLPRPQRAVVVAVAVVRAEVTVQQ